MKKSLLNIAVTMSLTGAVFSGSVLSTQAYADDLNIAGNNNSNDDATETYMYPGMGVGAATGTVIAGPVGFIVGGLIGAIVGSKQDVSSSSETTAAETTDTEIADNTVETDLTVTSSEDTSMSESTEQNTRQPGVQVAQLGTIHAVVDESIESQHDTLMDILTADLSLDIYFRSGSTDIEAFYPARLAAIADLMNTMDKLELHLDGYTDRRGNKTKNIELANERIEKVREQLINAGVDETRIISKAFGEMKMVSNAGDLEGYTFDRKVVIRFERSSVNSIHAMTSALSATEIESEVEDPAASPVDEATIPVVADATTRF